MKRLRSLYAWNGITVTILIFHLCDTYLPCFLWGENLITNATMCKYRSSWQENMHRFCVCRPQLQSAFIQRRDELEMEKNKPFRHIERITCSNHWDSNLDFLLKPIRIFNRCRFLQLNHIRHLYMSKGQRNGQLKQVLGLIFVWSALTRSFVDIFRGNRLIGKPYKQEKWKRKIEKKRYREDLKSSHGGSF